VIELHNVSKQYRGLTVNKDSGIYLWIKNIITLTGNRSAALLALNKISFSVSKGEIFGIYGENGAGKTTLIKILSGLLHPTEGEVKIDGLSGKRHIKNTVSYISTNGWMGLEWQLSARENLILYGNLFGLSGRKLSRKCDEVLEAVGMTEAKDKYISQLSAGMRQKITIARGLILDRPVIFYDEPSVSLDVPSARNLRSLIRADAAENRRTALIASHNTEDLSICGRIMFLSGGEIIAIGKPEELKEPFSGLEIIEVICLKQEEKLELETLPGVERVVYGTREGDSSGGAADGSSSHARDIQRIKISVRKAEFSLNTLVEFFIKKGIAVQSIKPIDFTLQEMYEYYKDQKRKAV